MPTLDRSIKDRRGKRAVDYVPEPKKKQDKGESKDLAKDMLIRALVAESGLTKEDFVFMLKRRMAIRKLLLG